MHGQGGESLIVGMKLHHASQINGADDIDIVQQERLVGMAGVLREKNSPAFFSPPPVSSRTSSREISIRMPKLSLAFR